jgi:hypothetical protein
MISMQLKKGAAAALLAAALTETPAMAKTFIILDFVGLTESAWSDGSRTYSAPCRPTTAQATPAGR